MALIGSLADMHIVELVQFPHGGRRTGELVVRNGRSSSRLYYHEGSLVHVRVGDLLGMDALVETLGWEEGEFEFHHKDAIGDERTIDGDLHKTVMHALIVRDERREAMRERQHAEQSDSNLDRLGRTLEGFVKAHEFARFATVLDEDGATMALAAAPTGALDDPEALWAFVHQTLQSYPGPGLKRLTLDDEDGSLIVQRLEKGMTLVVGATADAPLGAVFRSINRFASAELP